MTMTPNDGEVGTCHRCGIREGKERYYVPGPFSIAGATHEAIDETHYRMRFLLARIYGPS